MTSSDDGPRLGFVLAGILRSAPVVVFAYDDKGVCTFSEGAGLAALELQPGAMVGVDLWAYYADRPVLLDRLRRALGGETFRFTDVISDRTFDTWLLPLEDAPGPSRHALGISVDVTARARAEGDLGVYQALVDAAPQFIALIDTDRRLLYLNPGGRLMVGAPADLDVATTTIADYFTDEGLEHHLGEEVRAVQSHGAYDGESTLRHWGTGEAIPVHVSTFVITDPATGRARAIATMRSDLREVVAARGAVLRQVAHQRGLLVHLHEAQEDERRRIAGEIHDDSVQVMAAVNIRLQSLRRSLDSTVSQQRVEELDALDRSVRAATERLRRLLVELDPPQTEGMPVEQALHTTVSRGLHHDGEAAVDVRIHTEPSPIVARVILRIAREAVTNVRKHAVATTTRIELREIPGEYVLRVLDDGVGVLPVRVDPADPSADPLHRGVLGMRQRAESVGGSLTVSPRPGGGTIVEASLPHLLGHPDQAPSVSSSNVFLEQVMETIAEAYWAIDADWRYVFVNRPGYALLGHDPSDGVLGLNVWEVSPVPSDLRAAYLEARAAQIPVEVAIHHHELDRWHVHRVLPTAGGLSVFARDVTVERRADERAARETWMSEFGHQMVAAVTSTPVLSGAIEAALDLLLREWTVEGVRVTLPTGLTVAAGVITAASRVVDLELSGRIVGTVELAGERVPVDNGVLQLLALRLATHDGGESAQLPAELD